LTLLFLLNPNPRPQQKGRLPLLLGLQVSGTIAPQISDPGIDQTPIIAAPLPGVFANQLLDDISQAALIAVLVSATPAETLDTITQSANVAVVVSANAAQTLDTVSQSANLADVCSVSAAQTLDTIAQTANVQAIEQLTASQTLAGVSQSETDAVVEAISASQVLDSVSQSANVTVTAGGSTISISAAQTLGDATQSSTLAKLTPGAGGARRHLRIIDDAAPKPQRKTRIDYDMEAALLLLVA
jgi:uncharacterized protein (UPF0147 family)